MTKQRGLLFTEPMVLANIHWRKTQTRRMIKPQPVLRDNGNWDYANRSLGKKFFVASNVTSGKLGQNLVLFNQCPYGQAGDQLYGRETLYRNNTGEWRYKADAEQVKLATYTAPILLNEDKRLIPSIHMPKEAARLWFEITAIRAEQLHAISEADALAEGIYIFFKRGCYQIPVPSAPAGWVRTKDPIEAYVVLYNQINGITMEQNPWNWVVEYKSIKKPKEVLS
ncbi:hypothetical protein IC229_05690 [Spirosoma sp. BT702]|uniref:Uncharacterized protein n=1 Tax=Spirosoma profusum TaxID=2771354 RepID=A0A926XTZ8_9BACT|nr:hypothetical protein [Spirosoma profusum]MBD2700117.1 hypothetical protein [Spirosoma profusum]